MDQYYLLARRHFASAGEDEELEVTLQQLADIFHCSGRNVNFILKKLEESGWIRWQPGRGRGNRSRLRFMASCEAVVLAAAKELVERGDIKGAFEYVERHSQLPSTKDQFVYWLDTQFGYAPEVKNEQRTDTLRIPYAKPIECLDPSFVVFAVESHMVKQIFDCLVVLNAKTGKIEPHLAHYWTYCEEEMTWLFYLRKGVYFHHGREMTAHDVKFSLDRLKDASQPSPYQWLLDDVGSVHVVDTYAVSIRMKETNHLFLHMLSYDRASIVPADAVVSLGGRFQTTPVGTGPFKVARHDGNMLVLEAFPRYFDRRAHLDRIEIWFTPELHRKASVWEPSVHQRYQMRSACQSNTEAPQGWNTVEDMSKGCKFMTFNLDMDGPQQHKPFRDAVLCGIDRSLMSKHVPLHNQRPAEWFYYQEVELERLTGYDPDKAAELLRQSGYAGEALELCAPEYHAEDAEEIVRQMREMGIAAHLRLLPPDQAGKLEAIKHSHFCLAGILLDDDLELGLIELLLSPNSFIRSHLGTELTSRVESLIRGLLKVKQPEQRKPFFYRLEWLIKDQSAIMFIYHWYQRSVHHPSLRGVSLNNLGWVQFRDLWFEPLAKKANAKGETLDERDC